MSRKLSQLKPNDHAKIYEGVTDSIVLINPDYAIVDVNPAACKLAGRTREEIVGKPCYEINYGLKEPCTREDRKCSLREVSASGGSFSVVHEHLTRTGDRHYVEILAHPIKNGEGRVIQVVVIEKDITEEIMLEREAELLREVNNLLNAGAKQEEIFAAITQGLTSRFGYKLSAIYLLNEDRKSLTCKSYSIDSRVLAKAEKLVGVKALGYEAPLLDGSLLTEVVQTKRPIITCDIVELIKSHVDKKHLKALTPAIAKIVGIKCGIGVPLLAGDKLVGTIGVGSERELTKKDAERLARFGKQAGLAVDMAVVYEELEEAYEAGWRSFW